MYKITYELKTKDNSNTYEFTVDKVSIVDEKEKMELARTDSAKYHKSGMASIKIINTEKIK